MSGICVVVPGRGNKKAGRYYPTEQGVGAFMEATQQGYLSHLEKAYETDGTDYPVFPGGVGVLQPDAVLPMGNYKQLDRSVTRKLFLDIEKAAGVHHVRGRAFHGLRRLATDDLVREGATPTEIQASGNWSTSQTPMEIYRDGIKDQDRKRAAKKLSRRKAQRLGTDTKSHEIEELYPDSYTAVARTSKDENLTDSEVDEVIRLTKWAREELNLRPHAYQACALTN